MCLLANLLLALLPLQTPSTDTDPGRLLRATRLLELGESEAASAAFRELHEADPVRAAIGEALAAWDPLAGGRGEGVGEALARLGATPEERRARVGQGLAAERLVAVEALAGTQRSYPERLALHLSRVERAWLLHPGQRTARVDLARALLATWLAEPARGDARWRALALAEELYQADPRDPAALRLMLVGYGDAEHAPLARRALLRWEQVAPPTPRSRHLTARTLALLGEWDEVARVARAALEESAAWPGARRDLAHALLQRGQVAAAGELLFEAWSAARADGSAAARALLVRQRAEWILDGELASRDDLLAGLELDTAGLPPDLVGLDTLARGWLALAAGDRDGAREHLGTLEALGESAPPAERTTLLSLAHLLRARLHAHAGDPDSAAAELTRAEALDPGPLPRPIDELRGELLLARDEPAAAARAFERALRLHPGRLLSRRGLALGLAARSASDPALSERTRAAWAELAVQLAPSPADAPWTDLQRRARREARFTEPGTPHPRPAAIVSHEWLLAAPDEPALRADLATLLATDLDTALERGTLRHQGLDVPLRLDRDELPAGRLRLRLSSTPAVVEAARAARP